MVAVTYNGYSLPFPYNKFSFSENEKSFNFSTEFLIEGTSESDLVSKCQEAEQKLTEKNKDFVLDFGELSSTTEFNFSHSGNTGFLARPNLQKLGNSISVSLSRAYKFSVQIQLPFDQSGYSYRREGSFSVSYTPSRQRLINFTFLYTAASGQTCIDTYAAGSGGKSWATTVLAQLGGNYELVTENWSSEQEQKILNGKLSYKEILSNQSESVVNESAIVDPQVNYSANFMKTIGIATGYTPEPKTEVMITFSCAIDHDQVPNDVNLESVYHDTVKPWLVKHAYSVLGLSRYQYAGSGNYILQSERVNADNYNYRISGSVSFMLPRTSFVFLEASETITKNSLPNINFPKLYDGKDHTYNAYSYGKTKTLTRSFSISKLGQAPILPTDYITTVLGVSIEADENNGSWIFAGRSEKRSAEMVGINEPIASVTHENIIYHANFQDEYRLVVPAEGQDLSQLISGGSALPGSGSGNSFGAG